MNCSYRIIDKVHIGVSIRKTADANTVPFKNVPLKNVRIKSYDTRGFIISHPDLPKDAFLTFDQLPLLEVVLEKGIIKTEITFVERLLNAKTNGLQLIRTDTFDYLEMLDDRKEKDVRKKLKISNLKIGDKTTSAICREGIPMWYLGTFATLRANQKYDYTTSSYESFFKDTVQRAYFAYKDTDGYRIKEYPLTHKVVVELYELQNDESSEKFHDMHKNLEFILGVTNFHRERKGNFCPDGFKIPRCGGIGYEIGYVADIDLKVKRNKEIFIKEATDWIAKNYGKTLER